MSINHHETIAYPSAGQLLIRELRAMLRERGRLLRAHERRIEELERLLADQATATHP